MAIQSISLNAVPREEVWVIVNGQYYYVSLRTGDKNSKGLSYNPGINTVSWDTDLTGFTLEDSTDEILAVTK